VSELKTYRISSPDFINPLWFNVARAGRHAAVVQADRTVLLNGHSLSLRDPLPLPGTAVKVWLNARGYFVCALESDLALEEAAQRAAVAADQARRDAQLNALRAQAEAFNARLTLPFKWDVRIKDVLSGLSAESWGDGRNKATVEHIHLLEAFSTGRLTRKAGDFLCTARSGTNGMRYTSLPSVWRDADDQPYQPKVTCKTCLVQARRWINIADDVAAKEKP